MAVLARALVARLLHPRRRKRPTQGVSRASRSLLRQLARRLLSSGSRRVMHVLVTWGSKRGGTEGIGRMLADALREQGFDVVAAPAEMARELDQFHAVIAGGALYANRWPRSIRRFVARHARELRRVPV